MEIKLSVEFWGLLFCKEQSQIIYGALVKIQVLAMSTGTKYKENLYIHSVLRWERKVQLFVKTLNLQAPTSLNSAEIQEALRGNAAM